VIAFSDGGSMSRSRKSTTMNDVADHVLTWLFAGLLLIALVAGLFAQVSG
jgi:hypothetical protein